MQRFSCVVVAVLIQHYGQQQGKRVITATRKITVKDDAEISIGQKRVMGNRLIT